MAAGAGCLTLLLIVNWLVCMLSSEGFATRTTYLSLSSFWRQAWKSFGGRIMPCSTNFDFRVLFFLRSEAKCSVGFPAVTIGLAVNVLAIFDLSILEVSVYDYIKNN